MINEVSKHLLGLFMLVVLGIAVTILSLSVCLPVYLWAVDTWQM